MRVVHKTLQINLNFLYHNPKLISEVGQNAKKYIYHTWDDVILSATKIYNEFIAKSEKTNFYKETKKKNS